MIIDTRKIISITEANQNFSKAVRIGFSPAEGSMGYEELLEWIKKNEVTG